MLQIYSIENEGLRRRPETDLKGRAAEGAIWIDLINPSKEEEAAVEKALGFDIPTKGEMRDIEDSARFYESRGAIYMTAIIVAGVSVQRPIRSPVTFILTPKHLLTVRETDTLPFKTFEEKCARLPNAHATSDLLFTSILEQITQRIASVLESVTNDLDKVVVELFDGEATPQNQKRPKLNLQFTIERLGRHTALLAKLRESLLSINRLLTFFRQSAAAWLNDGARTNLKSLDRDVHSLTEYAAHLISEVGHLQSATFNLISYEQNQIIKVFSVAAVLFLPPTLVGTIYGMNFEKIPELKWAFGYPMALVLMVISAIIPFYWFKLKGWL